ncbi:Cd(II)/Pb(II)-responsive transcriptional regulator [Marinobacter sp. BGYM27]|uniref:Cd(II)/Pb(II)-responsive transcriptional regulator n=1 Tax=Marinobacter sp. BGYM27 TaxID=2975597 RepID=UPI0021A3AD49|nr:Cd(II)/Pb(II)-responsive transcriptional regulator [Marinobacter sp. BGYM27]MDG5500922.1 Cd(II)/Pb(II)-responsive transcriptional regulator [Marinobacter sp. BGYM27]
MRIGELARRTGFTQETIRYYEKIELIPQPDRSGANYRDYAAPYVDRLQFIANCRSLDMTLDEIRQLLELRDNPEARCGEANQLIDEHLQHVRHRIDELTQLADQLQVIQGECGTEQATRDCGILNELDRMSVSREDRSDGRVHNHVPGSHGHRPG